MAQEKDVDMYEIAMRGGGILLSVLLWIVSMRFSVDGFKIASQEDAWVGWILGAMVTYLQVMFNRGAPNKTLHMAGVVAYIYGMATNLIGIIAIRGNDFGLDMIMQNPLSFMLQAVVILSIAAAVEIIPEHLAIYCIRQDGADGDFLDSLFRGMPKKNGTPRTGFKKTPAPQQNNQRDNRNQRPQNNRPDNRHQQNQPQNKRPGVDELMDRVRQRPTGRDIPRNRGDRRDNVTIRNGDEL